MLDSRTARRIALATITVVAIGCLALAGSAPGAQADGSPAPALFRSFLPGISADSAVPGGQGPGLSPLVTTQNVSTWAPGGLWVYGEVHNGLPTTIAGVTVTATASDNAGNVVATHTSPASVDQIGAGSNGPFRILLAGATDPGLQVSTAVAGYAITAGPALTDQVTVTASGPRPWEIHTPDTAHHRDIITVSTTVQAIDGTITNNSTQPIANPQVFVAVYDGTGRVAMVSPAAPVSVAFQGTGPAVLNPGQTGSFTVLVPIPDFYQIQPGPAKLVGFLGPVGSAP